MPYTKDRSTRAAFQYRSYSDVDGNVSESYSYPSRVLTRTHTGDRVPKFRTLIRNGSDATSAANGRKDEVLSYEPAGMVVRFGRPPFPPLYAPNNVGTIEASGCYNTPSFVSPYEWAPVEADNRAKSKLYGKIKQQYEQWNSLIFVGEILETARMFISPFKKLREHTTHVLNRGISLKKKYRRKEMGRLLETLSATWLEYNFGVKPLLNDITDFAIALGRYDSPDDFRRAKLSGQGNTEQAYSSDNVTGAFGYLSTTQSVRDFNRARIVRRCGMSYTLSGPFGTAKDLSRLVGFGQQNFVPTAWEIIPFSFVVDYFVNVGEILSALYTDMSLVTWQNKTVINEYERKFVEVVNPRETKALMDAASGPTYAKFNSYSGTLGGYKSRTTLFRRTAEALSVPELRMSVPGIDSLKWLNLGALMALNNTFRSTPFRR